MDNILTMDSAPAMYNAPTMDDVSTMNNVPAMDSAATTTNVPAMVNAPTMDNVSTMNNVPIESNYIDAANGTTARPTRPVYRQNIRVRPTSLPLPLTPPRHHSTTPYPP